jgi:hypothetical protein
LIYYILGIIFDIIKKISNSMSPLKALLEQKEYPIQAVLANQVVTLQQDEEDPEKVLVIYPNGGSDSLRKDSPLLQVAEATLDGTRLCIPVVIKMVGGRFQRFQLNCPSLGVSVYFSSKNPRTGKDTVKLTFKKEEVEAMLEAFSKDRI